MLDTKLKSCYNKSAMKGKVIIMKLRNTIELLTEKNKVKANIREQLTKAVSVKREWFAKAEQVENGVYEIPVHNADNTQTVYIRFEIKVSEKSASELAPKTRKPKEKASAETIVVE